MALEAVDKADAMLTLSSALKNVLNVPKLTQHTTYPLPQWGFDMLPEVREWPYLRNGLFDLLI